MTIKHEQKDLMCRVCCNKLHELELEGNKQNICPFCGSVNSCAPIDEFEKQQGGAE